MTAAKECTACRGSGVGIDGATCWACGGAGVIVRRAVAS
jgi:DnaJ-class molecular chaperone